MGSGAVKEIVKHDACSSYEALILYQNDAWQPVEIRRCEKEVSRVY